MFLFSLGTGKETWKLANSAGHHWKIVRKPDIGDRMVARVGKVTVDPVTKSFQNIASV